MVKKKRLILLGWFLLAILVSYAQDSVLARKHIAALSAPDMHGRGYAYNGDSIAADYLRKQFQDMDIQPFAYDNYYHPYGFNVFAMEGPVAATLDGKDLTDWKQFALAPYTKSANQTFRILPITPETLLNTEHLTQFCLKHKKDWKNSLLYVDMNQLSDKELSKTLNQFLHTLYLYNGKIPFQGFLIGVKDIPVWSFSFAHDYCDYVLCYVKADLMDHAKKIKLLCTNTLSYHRTQNVCALIPGTEAPDSLIVIGGHYDHLGQMGDDVLFAGAHDNASGTAAVLDMAHYFKAHPLRYTTVFTLFSGEEAGLLGSLRFVKDSLFDFSKVKMMLNIDLMGGGDDGFTVVNSDGENTKDFFQTLVDINQKSQAVKEVRPRTNANISDHAPFILKGMPAVFVYTMGGRTGRYHQPDDTNENLSLSAYQDIVSLLIHGLERIR